MRIDVWQSGWRPHHGLLRMGSIVMPCVLGRSGIVRDGREGDGATPAGSYPMRRVLYRADRRSPPETKLHSLPIGPRDGWCDAPDHPLYNRPVRLPFEASCETLRRRDRLYDTVVVLGHNDDPVVPGLGSAIFMHVAREDFRPTLGCVALTPQDLDAVLAHLSSGSTLTVHPNPD